MHQPKSLDKIKEDMISLSATQSHPMEMTRVEDVREACGRLQNLESHQWCQVWSDLAGPFEEKAAALEQAGKLSEARDSYMLAFNYYRMARFPVINTPEKQAAHQLAVKNYGKASRYFDPPVETVVIPFHGKMGEGNQIPVYIRKPKGVDRPPVLINHAGVDVFKEEQCLHENEFLTRGIATLSMDMAGTGEAPVIGSLDAERIYDPVIEYLQNRPDVDGSRIAILGMSFGGYWATKLAHLDLRLSAAVCWGGGVHHTFQRDWQPKSKYAPSHLGNENLIVTRSNAFGIRSEDEWLDFCPKLSLLDQGILDQPCVPLLLVNGKDDLQVSVEDYYLVLEHGSPKTVRLFPGGHMGNKIGANRQLVPATIAVWLQNQLAAARGSLPLSARAAR